MKRWLVVVAMAALCAVAVGAYCVLGGGESIADIKAYPDGKQVVLKNVIITAGTDDFAQEGTPPEQCFVIFYVGDDSSAITVS